MDRGAAATARLLARRLQATLHVAEVSRLVVDLNRSIGHPGIFSPYTRALTGGEKGRILEAWYHPYRDRVMASIERGIARGRRVFHLSSHSFTPVLRGRVRRTDVGLLYDPSRTPERALAGAWKREIALIAPRLVVRRNHPYRGIDDGFMIPLRRRFPEGAYVGIELEINQKHYRSTDAARRIRSIIVASLETIRSRGFF